MSCRENSAAAAILWREALRARRAADKARTNGLPQVGILNSSDFSSLNPGYYVTFSGIYDTQSQANAALPNARSKGFPTAYVREVSN